MPPPGFENIEDIDPVRVGDLQLGKARNRIRTIKCEQWIAHPIAPLSIVAKLQAVLESSWILPRPTQDRNNILQQLHAPGRDVGEEVTLEFALLRVFDLGIEIDHDRTPHQVTTDVEGAAGK